MCCNNAECCDLPVNEILFGMVHNAMSSPSAGFIFFANHLDDPIVESLDAGKDGTNNPDHCYVGGTGVEGKVVSRSLVPLFETK